MHISLTRVVLFPAYEIQAYSKKIKTGRVTDVSISTKKHHASSPNRGPSPSASPSTKISRAVGAMSKLASLGSSIVGSMLPSSYTNSNVDAAALAMAAAAVHAAASGPIR